MDADEKTPTNPAAVIRHKDAFFRPNGTRDNFRRPENVDLINDVNSGVFTTGASMRVWNELKQILRLRVISNLLLSNLNYENFHLSATGPRLELGTLKI